MTAAYVTFMAMLIAWAIVIANTDAETLAMTSLFDPFGIAAFGELTQYWTVFDRNTLTPEFEGNLAKSRVIWLGVAAVFLAITLWRFSFSIAARGRKKLGKKESQAAVPSVNLNTRYLPVFNGQLVVQQFLAQTRSEFRAVVRSIPFYVLLLFGMFNVVGGFFGAISQMFGTPVLPSTRMMLQIIQSNFLFIASAIVIYYAGDLVHRERQHKVSEIMDALPYPNAIMILSKILGLWFVIATLLTVVMITAIVVQVGHGYSDIQIGTYLFGLHIAQGWRIYLQAVLAIFIQVLVGSKYLGMLVTIVVFIGIQTLNSYGWEHTLYSFGTTAIPLSDMNAWGHYITRHVNVGLYWSLFCVILVVCAHLFAQRGISSGLSDRLRIARQRFTSGVAGSLVLASVAMVASGSWIFYNMNVLNRYETSDDVEQLQAEFEKNYKQYKEMKSPSLIEVDANVDIYPAERRIESRGKYVLVNNTDEPLQEIHFSINRELTVNSLIVPSAQVIEENRHYGYHRYALDRALEPGRKMTVEFDLSWVNEGFRNSNSSTRVVHNGTFVNNTEMMPLIGYTGLTELGDNNTRKKYGLGPVERSPKFGDPKGYGVNQLGIDTHIDFRTTVSTSEDQIAISPGYLQREWTEGNRRYFEYKMDAPIWPFLSFLSARYDVVKDSWRDRVAIEVYHHPDHDYNVERMIYATKKGLDYFTEAFSDFQYRQFRILEFPAYERFAQSFPNTIPFSEAIGFVADLSDEKYIDYVFYVTAHELAHQWWAHQVIGANMQGATVIVETLAQYSALMVMEHEYGPEKMRRFLKYELDNYLRSRGGELIEELPLSLVEGQGYIHYRKGSVVMYSLKDAIGEEAVNQALRNFIGKHAFNEAPFPDSQDLISEFRAVAGDDHQQFITDLFDKITLFDLRVTEATSEPTDDGRWRVKFDVTSSQLEADGSGKETEVPMAIKLDLAVFPASGDELGDDDLPDPILIEQRVITGGESSFEFIIDTEPARVGIDPYHKMIDKNPSDNLKLI